MILLSLESSTALGGVALFKNGVLLAEESSLRQRSHSEFINSACQRILTSQNLSLKDIDQIAVTQGPGSFTGIRVAGNIAKSFGFATGKKLWVTDTLSVLASQISWVGPTLVGINAFKNMLYVSFYKGSQKLDGPLVIKIEDLEKTLGELFGGSEVSYIGDSTALLDPKLRIKTIAGNRTLLVPS